MLPYCFHGTTAWKHEEREHGKVSLISGACWSERRDLNSGPPVPQTGALTGLRYAPTDTETINSMAIGRNTLRDMPMKSRMLLAMRKLTS